MNSSPAISVRVRYTPGPALGEIARMADDLGLAGLWVSEPWGYDAGAVLGHVAAQTHRITLGTHVVSVYARTPAATAGLAASLAALSRERFRLGLGCSGPQVVEGWHCVAFDQPIDRLRDTVAIVRAALRGERVEHEGLAASAPRPGGRGRPLRFAQLDAAREIPIYLAALGPRAQRLTAAIADGWTPTPYSPDHHDVFAAPLLGELARCGRIGAVSVAPVCPLAIDDDLDGAIDLERGWSALYLGGMGSTEGSFYAASATRMGYGAMVDAIRKHWDAGDRRRAQAEVDSSYADAIGLFGAPSRVRSRLDRYRAAGVDEIIVELRARDLDDQLEDLRQLWEVATA